MKIHDITDPLSMVCGPSNDGLRYNLTCPKTLPKASSFLWNEKTLLQVNCRGYVMSKYLEAEASKYSHAPNIEASTFFQPEQPFYAHHPGRFFYLHDVDSDVLYSAPYEPVRKMPDQFVFSAGQTDIRWQLNIDNVIIDITVELAEKDVVEKWNLTLRNESGRPRHFKLYPYFTIGFMSWMNQSAKFDKRLNGIIADSVTPYQKLHDYPRIKSLKDKTFFLADQMPDAWETSRERFEGEGGLSYPDGVAQGLSNKPANYETPVAVMQYDVNLEVSEARHFNFLFGPAKSRDDIVEISQKHFTQAGQETDIILLEAKLEQSRQRLQIETPDAHLNNYVNNWLARQLYMHGHINRLAPDPQTRNYLQDNMGMSYLDPKFMRQAICKTLEQQNDDGSLPDGILLRPDAKLNYINQVPHTDHNVWLPVCLETYLDETNDYELLKKNISGGKHKASESIFERATRAMDWLISNQDARGLSLISQGDWCDPMNMVGPKGKGVSGWLTMATAHALNVWAKICTTANEPETASKMRRASAEFTEAAQNHVWDGAWFIRGISDDGISFGKSTDEEGSIFLNPQSWAIMSKVATDDQVSSLVGATQTHLVTPYGAQLLAPPFTRMHEHIGRVTQKHPGSAENGSVYNHASIFYIYSLYQIGETDKAYNLLKAMLPNMDLEDVKKRGQLPIFIPNYYRGAFKEIPDTAGRSSHLFNTGTISWYYRCVVEELIGFKGISEGVVINPKIPTHWDFLNAKRSFRGAMFDIKIIRGQSAKIEINGTELTGNIFTDIKAGEHYKTHITLAS